MSNYTQKKYEIIKKLTAEQQEAQDNMTLKNALATAKANSLALANQVYSSAMDANETAQANLVLANTALASLSVASSANTTASVAAKTFLAGVTALLELVNTMVLLTLDFAEHATGLSDSIIDYGTDNSFVSTVITADAATIATDAGNAVTDAIAAFAATVNLLNSAYLGTYPVDDATKQIKLLEKETTAIVEQLKKNSDAAQKSEDDAQGKVADTQAESQAAYIASTQATNASADATAALDAATSALTPA